MTSSCATNLSMTSPFAPVLVVVGAGPGLGLSVAHRFGSQGHTVALISRTDTRHQSYLDSLAAAGIEAAAFTADADDPAALRAAVGAVRERFGRIDIGYYGPADARLLAGDIVTLDATGAETAFRSVVSAVDFASLIIGELTERGSGGLLFVGGLSSVVPMPPLGGMPCSRARRKSSSRCMASASPRAESAACSTKRSRCTTGSTSSE